MMQIMEEDQVFGGLGVLEVQGNLSGTTETGLECGLRQQVTSACLLAGCLPVIGKPESRGDMLHSVALIRSNAVLTLDLQCPNCLVLEVLPTLIGLICNLITLPDRLPIFS